MKNKIYIAGLIFALSLCVHGVSRAATVNSTFDLNINCDKKCQDDGLVLFRYKGKITETVHKTVNFVTESDTNTAQSFNLNLDDSVSLVSTPTTGDWVVTGGQYDTPPSDGIMYEVLRTKIDGKWDIFQIGTSIPQDENNFVIESEDPNIVSCEDNICKAVGQGVTHLTVSFPDVSQSDKMTQQASVSCIQKNKGPFGITIKENTTCSKSYVINGAEDGYGSIIFKAKDISQKKGTHEATPVVMAYSFPSITYTVTVPDTTNNSQITACNGVTNVTTSGTTVNWTYSDPDNDPQTNYAIDIATDASFEDIVDTETAPDNTDVSAVRSLAISGLDPNTTYYARIQSYNETNGWGDYTSCGASFTTLDGPVDGSCGENLNTCEDGTAESTGLNRWVCHGKSGGQDSEVCTFFKPVFSCEASPRRAVVDEDVEYTVDPDDGDSYQWFDGANLISGENSSTYSYAFPTTGTYNRTVKMIKTDGATETASCSSVTVGCDDSLKPADSICDIDGTKKNYICQPDGTWLPGTVSSCEPDMELIDNNNPGAGIIGAIGGFSFNPSLVPVGGFCKLFVNVKNAKVCKLVNQSNQDIPLVNTGNSPFFKIDGVNRAVGTYKLYCKATTTASHAFKQLGLTRSCYSSPNVNEN